MPEDMTNLTGVSHFAGFGWKFEDLLESNHQAIEERYMTLQYQPSKSLRELIYERLQEQRLCLSHAVNGILNPLCELAEEELNKPDNEDEGPGDRHIDPTTMARLMDEVLQRRGGSSQLVADENRRNRDPISRYQQLQTEIAALLKFAEPARTRPLIRPEYNTNMLGTFEKPSYDSSLLTTGSKWVKTVGRVIGASDGSGIERVPTKRGDDKDRDGDNEFSELSLLHPLGLDTSKLQWILEQPGTPGQPDTLKNCHRGRTGYT